jgi:hypothetical protein
MTGRRLAVGDVHGCFRELCELIERLRLRESDEIIFVGDLVDRGPEPVKVVDLVSTMAMSGMAKVIAGNHEEKMLRYLRREEECKITGKKNPMRSPHPDRLAQWKSQPPPNVAWLNTLPVLLDLGDWLAVHGGFEDKPMAKQKNDKMLRCRFVSEETGEMVPISLDDDPWENPPGAVWWSTRWKGDKNVVYGHAVHSLSTPRVDRNGLVECWGIDTGCVFGGRLTALNLDTREVVQVQAHAQYAAPPVKLRP